MSVGVKAPFADGPILDGMAKPAGAAKPAKPTRAEKKAARAAKKQSRRETWRSMGQAFTLTRKQDPKFLPYTILFGVLAAAVVYLLVFWLADSTLYGIPFAVFAFLIVAMLVFSRRAQAAMYGQAEGQPGAAGWLLQQQLKGDWRLTQGIAGTTQLDVVHRLVGRPGIVLVAEGAQHRVRGLDRPGEEEDLAGRRRHPDLRPHRGHRRGRRAAGQAEPVPAQAAQQPEQARGRRAGQAARRARRARGRPSPRVRCRRAPRCATSNAPCGDAAESR